MHPAINAWSKACIYNGILEDGTLGRRRLLAQEGVMFIDTHGEMFTGSRESFYNTSEAYTIASDLRDRIMSFRNADVTVGVICMYNAQIPVVENACREMLPNDHDFLRNNCVFRTVDGFQGGEKDVIYVSFVRNGDDGRGVGFLNNRRRLNVAATRAKRLCIFVGNLGFLERDGGALASLGSSLRQRELVFRM